MKAKIKEQLKSIRKHTKLLLAVFAFALLLLVIAFALYFYDYSSRALLKTYLGGEQVSGANRNKIEAVAQSLEDKSKQDKLTLTYKDKKWEMSLESANWQIDEKKSADQVFNYGHGPNQFLDVVDYLQSVFHKKKFDPVYTFNESMIDDWISSINGEIGKPKKEANIQVKNGSAEVIEPSSGELIDEQPLRQAILDHLALKTKGDIKVDLVQADPIISKADAEVLKDQAVKLVADPVELVGANDSVTLSTKNLGAYIELKRKVEKPKSFLRSKPVYGETYVSFSSDQLKSFIQKNTDILNEKAVDAQFTIDNGQVSLKTQSKSGQEVAIDEAVNLAISTLEKGTSKKITLPLREQKPSITASTAADIQKLGIKEIIGTATTSFGNSPQNRIHNIQTGVSYISGSLIKPGEEFSTIGRLGAIDGSTGYLPELVIKENATVPEFGGGLCQVSTTLFRSVMNSGLKVTERQNHSYRVSYYEPPVGMDATIYSPAPDFKFINTTDNYILIAGRVVGNKVTFDIYGTKDGRTVEVTQPNVYDITSPPDPIYTEDPSLAPGEEKQTDHAHPGAKADFYYRVTKGGKLIENEHFLSSYVAWPAKFSRNSSAPPADQQVSQ